MAIYSRLTQETWWFSIVTLVYQRVSESIIDNAVEHLLFATDIPRRTAWTSAPRVPCRARPNGFNGRSWTRPAWFHWESHRQGPFFIPFSKGKRSFFEEWIKKEDRKTRRETDRETDLDFMSNHYESLRIIRNSSGTVGDGDVGHTWVHLASWHLDTWIFRICITCITSKRMQKSVSFIQTLYFSMFCGLLYLGMG